jgi:mRNA capping enzyme, C-terminal domain/mRNA capping enzyme, catalytic domain
MPVAVDQSMLQPLAFGYIFTMKANGVRNFMIVSNLTGDIYLLQRNLKHIKLSGQWPFINKASSKSEAKWYLFDIELYNDQILIIDTLIFHSVSCIAKDIVTRMELAKYFCLHLSTHHIPLDSKSIFYKLSIPGSRYPFVSVPVGDYQVRCKPLYIYDHLEAIWKARDQLDFDVDGIIFVRRLCPYSPFCCDPMSVLKWKPMITIDFQVVPIEEEGEHNVALLSAEKVVFETCFLEEADSFCHKIVEFTLKEDKKWYPLTIRTDKPTANTMDVIERTYEAMKHNVTLEQLIDFTL